MRCAIIFNFQSHVCFHFDILININMGEVFFCCCCCCALVLFLYFGSPHFAFCFISLMDIRQRCYDNTLWFSIFFLFPAKFEVLGILGEDMELHGNYHLFKKRNVILIDYVDWNKKEIGYIATVLN